MTQGNTLHARIPTTRAQAQHALGPAERAVYALAQARGGIPAEEIPLYRRPIAMLRKAGLLHIDSDTGAAIAARPSEPPPSGERATHAPTMRPPPAPTLKRPVLVTLSTRVDPAVLRALDARGGSRADAARAVLEIALGLRPN
jgi:hypothetical protein